MSSSMSIGNNYSNIDTSAINNVANQILSRAEINTQRIDTSAKTFTASQSQSDLGINLYSGNISSEQAKFISMQNSGYGIQLNKNVLENIQYLNTQAQKINLESHIKNMDGKVYINNQDYEPKKTSNKNNLATTFISLESESTDKDKKDTPNPFIYINNNHSSSFNDN